MLALVGIPVDAPGIPVGIVVRVALVGMVVAVGLGVGGFHSEGATPPDARSSRGSGDDTPAVVARFPEATRNLMDIGPNQRRTNGAGASRVELGR